MSGATLDLSDQQQQHFDQRLRDNHIIWFGSVRPDGRPHFVPVWFFWDGQIIHVFSQPNQKIRNLSANPNVTLALDDTDEGEDVVIVEGRAEVQPGGDIASVPPGYLAKYAEGIKGLGMTPEAMLSQYNQNIRITPTRFYSY